MRIAIRTFVTQATAITQFNSLIQSFSRYINGLPPTISAAALRLIESVKADISGLPADLYGRTTLNFANNGFPMPGGEPPIGWTYVSPLRDQAFFVSFLTDTPPQISYDETSGLSVNNLYVESISLYEGQGLSARNAISEGQLVIKSPTLPTTKGFSFTLGGSSEGLGAFALPANAQALSALVNYATETIIPLLPGGSGGGSGDDDITGVDTFRIKRFSLSRKGKTFRINPKGNISKVSDFSIDGIQKIIVPKKEIEKITGQKIKNPDKFTKFKMVTNQKDLKAEFREQSNIIYDQSSGRLWLDANGRGKLYGGGGVFAQIMPDTTSGIYPVMTSENLVIG